jgi:hypothetical protein
VCIALTWYEMNNPKIICPWCSVSHKTHNRLIFWNCITPFFQSLNHLIVGSSQNYLLCTRHSIQRWAQVNSSCRQSWRISEAEQKPTGCWWPSREPLKLEGFSHTSNFRNEGGCIKTDTSEIQRMRRTIMNQKLDNAEEMDKFLEI